MKIHFQKHTIRQFIRFVLVGVINTAIGLGTTYFLMGGLGMDYRPANAFGYLAGLINAFFWNKFWVFESWNSRAGKEFLTFIIIFVICFGLQFVVLVVLKEILGWNKYLAQLVAMGCYTVINFILNRLYTFAVKR